MREIDLKLGAEDLLESHLGFSQHGKAELHAGKGVKVCSPRVDIYVHVFKRLFDVICDCPGCHAMRKDPFCIEPHEALHAVIPELCLCVAACEARVVQRCLYATSIVVQSCFFVANIMVHQVTDIVNVDIKDI